jgi:hypothetical protein
MYTDENHWKISPLHPDNNLQGESWRGLPHQRFLTLDSPALVERQKAVTRKIVSELKDVPNVYYEIANEPASGPHDSPLAKDVHAWHEAIIREIVETEASLPRDGRHLIAYNDHYQAGRGIGPVPRADNVSILNVHYLPKLIDILAESGKRKALAIDETRWIAHPKFGSYANTMKPVSGRLEAWEFFMGGGAVYSNLNFAYQPGKEIGDLPESNEFKGYLRKLKEFIGAFDFVRMRPDTKVIADGLPESSFGRAISEPGKQYGIYIHHASYGKGRNRYEPNEESRKIDLTLDLPAGGYRLEWLRPADLKILQSQTLPNHSGGRIALNTSPEYQVDVAMRIVSSRKP